MDDSIVLAISLKMETMSLETPGEYFLKALQMAKIDNVRIRRG